MWSVCERRLVRATTLEYNITAVAFTADGLYLAVASTSRGISLISTTTMTLHCMLPCRVRTACQLGFDRSGQHLGVVDVDGSIELLRGQSSAELAAAVTTNDSCGANLTESAKDDGALATQQLDGVHEQQLVKVRMMQDGNCSRAHTHAYAYAGASSHMRARTHTHAILHTMHAAHDACLADLTCHARSPPCIPHHGTHAHTRTRMLMRTHARTHARTHTRTRTRMRTHTRTHARTRACALSFRACALWCLAPRIVSL